MFHAIGSKEKLTNCDLHYSYSKEEFELFLKRCVSSTSLQECLSDVTNSTKDVITFDDGHVSNYDAAISIKELICGSADFFINGNMVGKKGFMSWSQLREIQQIGMSIQSHSLDHVYLSDLTYEQQLYQLTAGKKILEDKLGSEVVILAPPGGRYNQDTVNICKKLGYEHISISQPGRWSGGYLSSRIPVLRGTSVDELLSCKNIISPFMYKQMAKYKITGTAKKILGNGLYDTVRTRLLSSELGVNK